MDNADSAATALEEYKLFLKAKQRPVTPKLTISKVEQNRLANLGFVENSHIKELTTLNNYEHEWAIEWLPTTDTAKNEENLSEFMHDQFEFTQLKGNLIVFSSS
jgi:hypothetical protein